MEFSFSESFCPKHLNEYTHYCHKDNSLLCSEDIASHSNHQIYVLKDFFFHSIPQIQQFLILIKKKIGQIPRIKQTILQSQEQTLIQIGIFRNKYFSILRDIQNITQSALRDFLSTSFRAKLKLSRFEDSLKERKKYLNSLYQTFETYISKSFDDIHPSEIVDIQQMAQNLSFQMSQFENIDDQITQIPPQQNELSKSFSRESANLIKIIETMHRKIRRNYFQLASPKELKPQIELDTSQSNHELLSHSSYSPTISNFSHWINTEDATKNIILTSINNQMKNKVVKSLIPAFSASVQINDRIYISGGKNKGNILKSTFILTDDMLVALADMKHRTQGHTLIGLNNDCFYSVGGYRNKKDCEKFKIMQNKWRSAPSLNQGKNQLNGCSYKEYLFVFGGNMKINNNSFYSFSTIEKLNAYSSNSSWIIINLNQKASWSRRIGTGVINIQNKYILLFGGRTDNGRNLQDCLKFYPESNNMEGGPRMMKEDYFNRNISIMMNHSYIFCFSKNSRFHVFDFHENIWLPIQDANQ